MAVTHHIDKLGIVGSTVAALCCLGVPAFVTAASAIGLGFLVNDAVLAPLMGVSLLILLVGLGLGWRHHHKPWALVLGVLGGALLAVSTFVWHARPGSYVGIAMIVLASVLNVLLARPHHRERLAYGRL